MAIPLIVIWSCANPAAAAGRTELCARLSRQVDAAILQNPKAPQVAAARALQRRGDRLCAIQKQAQGIRKHANALRLLGAKPAVDTQ